MSETTDARNLLPLVTALESLPLIGIVRTSYGGGVEAVRALTRGGLTAVELTLTTPSALESIGQLCAQGDAGAVIGAGSVRTVADARSAISAGAGFLVTPTVHADVLAEAARFDVPVVCGAFTPTEVDIASSQAAFVKLFPATLGGPSYIRDLLAPMPELALIPTGGVTVHNASEWFRAGAKAVAVGSALVPSAPCDADEISRRARVFRAEILRASDLETQEGFDAPR